MTNTIISVSYAGSEYLNYGRFVDQGLFPIVPLLVEVLDSLEAFILPGPDQYPGPMQQRRLISRAFHDVYLPALQDRPYFDVEGFDQSIRIVCREQFFITIETAYDVLLFSGNHHDLRHAYSAANAR